MADEGMTELAEMTNAPVEVEVRGTTYEVRSLTWGDRMKIENRLSKKFSEIEYGIPRDVIAVIHVMLSKSNPILTTEEVAEMFDADNEDTLQRLWMIGILDKKTAEVQAGNVARAKEEMLKELAKADFMKTLLPPKE